jgi:hypothetical protein
MSQLKTSISWGIGLNLVKMLAIYLVMVLLFHRPDYFIHFHGDTMSYFEPIITNFLLSVFDFYRLSRISQ